MILDDIVARKRKDLARRREELPVADLKARCRSAPSPRGFARALAASRGPHVIAEVKRATPRGPLRPDCNAVAQARACAKGGAAALSCLTDVPFFATSIDDLRDIRRDVSLPVLRKDFIIHEHQIYETRAALADAMLLIVRILDRGRLRDFMGLGAELGLDLLVEAYDARDLDAALDAGSRLVGINTRDLETFRVDFPRAIRMREGIPDGVVTVAESGVRSREDMTVLAQAGFHAALIGEELMTAADPAKRVAELLGREVPA